MKPRERRGKGGLGIVVDCRTQHFRYGIPIRVPPHWIECAPTGVHEGRLRTQPLGLHSLAARHEETVRGSGAARAVQSKRRPEGES